MAMAVLAAKRARRRGAGEATLMLGSPWPTRMLEPRRNVKAEDMHETLRQARTELWVRGIAFDLNDRLCANGMRPNLRRTEPAHTVDQM